MTEDDFDDLAGPGATHLDDLRDPAAEAVAAGPGRDYNAGDDDGDDDALDGFGGEPTEEELPETDPSRLTIGAMAALVFAALVALLVAVALLDTSPPTPEPTGDPTPRGLPAEDDVVVVLDRRAQRVAEARGLEFTFPPELVVLPSADLEAHARERVRRRRSHHQRWGTAWRALLDQTVPVDPAASVEVRRVAYDPVKRRLFTDRAGAETLDSIGEDLDRALLEALLDQHWAVRRPELDGSRDDRADLFDALVDADIEMHLTLLADPAADTAPGLDLSDVMGASAEEGPVWTVARTTEVLAREFVGAVAEVGELGRAHDDPPATHADLADVTRWREGRRPLEVAQPAADDTPDATGSLGPLRLALMLGDGELSPSTLDAAAGWGGDTFVTWVTGGRACIRASVVAQRDDSELVAAIEAWADDRPWVELADDEPVDTVTFTSCRGSELVPSTIVLPTTTTTSSTTSTTERGATFASAGSARRP